MCDLMMARASVSIRGRGVIRRGSVLCADDPVVAAHGGSFRPLNLQHYCGGGGVEQMTAAPGEKRDVQLPGNGDARAIREWAAANGYEVSARGKLPAEVVDAYREAHQE